MSALIPYMGGAQDATFLTPGKWSKVFRCPSDQWLDVDPPGYRIYNNVDNATGTTYFPVSYGVNVDVASVVDMDGVARIDSGTNSVGVVYGPTVAGYGNANIGASVDCKLAKVRKPSEVLLYADCGTRPGLKSSGSPLDFNDALFYTTNYMVYGSAPQSDWGKLSGVALTDWLKDRIPYMRHNSRRSGSSAAVQKLARINICFVDGHAESVDRDHFDQVRVSPWMR
jgi:prepilin-type processing-associated H-X9-DG protein